MYIMTFKKYRKNFHYGLFCMILGLSQNLFAEGPCDIYEAANTPCVAAHSTVRALYSSYNGNLYQVRRKDNSTKDIPVLVPGGYADISVQDEFCAGSSCTVSIIYDQTSNHNDLKKSGVAHWLSNGGAEADASFGKASVNGHTVHGIYVTAWSKVAYRNNSTKGIATGNEAESMYMVVDGKRYSSDCCFDYGNAETSGNDDGNGTMEAIYWGTDVGWGGYGVGNGPWVAADLENGMFKGNAGGWQYGDTHKTPWPTAQSVIADYATAFLKGPSDNTFKLKAGNAKEGELTTMWDGSRPSPGYSPKSLQGAIILGTGGDGSNGGTGTFFEGAMTIGNPPDSIDDKIQANIVAAGYGSTVELSSSSSSSVPQTPYSSAEIPGTIQMENYDNGGSGVSYYDTDSKNAGGVYRNDGVDIDTADGGSSYVLGWVGESEWTEYTVDVSAAGPQPFQARVASNGDGGSFHLELDGTDITSSLTVPNTGSWATYEMISGETESLSAGTHVLRFVIDSPYFNIDWIHFGEPLVSLPQIKSALQMKTQAYRIYDLHGKYIGKISANSLQECSIKVRRDYPAGVYLVHSPNRNGMQAIAVTH